MTKRSFGGATGTAGRPGEFSLHSDDDTDNKAVAKGRKNRNEYGLGGEGMARGTGQVERKTVGPH